jgi:GntR family transcriptional regulator
MTSPTKCRHLKADIHRLSRLDQANRRISSLYGLLYCTYDPDKGDPAVRDGIDRSSPEPYYLQLARILQDHIKDGTYSAGAQIPGESELCRTYDLARSTVRETLRTLEQQRVIRLVPRRGAFVSDLKDNRWMLRVTQGFFEPEAHSSDAVIETEVLRSGVEPLPPSAAAALELPDSEPGFALERVRQVNGVPALHSTNWLPAEVGVLLKGKPVLWGAASLNATLREAGIHIFSARRELAAIAASANTARRLQLPKNSPVLRITSASKDADGRTFDYYESLVRSDALTIAVSAEAGELAGD